MKYATIIVSALIITIVLVPGPNLPDMPSFVGFDKLVHIGLFGLWALAVRYDFNSANFNFFTAFIAGVCFSIFTEILQLFVEGRSFDLYDMVADAIGLIAGLLVSGFLLRFLRK